MKATLSTQSQVFQSSDVPDFVTERKENKSLSNLSNPKLYLVVDLGTYLIKYSMFSIYDLSRVFILNMELKDSKEILKDGIINQNLLKRDIERKLTSLSELGTDVTVLVITPKPYVNSHAVPNMEYKEKTKEVKELINREVTSFSRPDSLHDWSIMSKTPEKDKLAVYMESTNYDIIINIINVMIDLKMHDYKIVSPVQSQVPIGKFYNEETLIVDIGHSNTVATIVKGQEILRSKIVQIGSKGINEKLNMPLADAVKIKHNSSIKEYPGECITVLENIRKEVRELVEDYEKISLTSIGKVLIIGGVANSDVENLFDLDSFRIPIEHVEMDIENVDVLPRETRNYIATSYGAVINDLYSSEYEGFEVIDYSSPKDSKMIKLKKLIKWFSQNKKYAYAVTASMLLSVGIASYGASFINGEDIAYKSTLSDYEGQLATLQNEITSQESRYNELLNSTTQNNMERHNIGDMLTYLTKITPPNLNVKKLNLDGNSETGTIIVTSSDERLVSTFITLLQDTDSGIFTKANIGKVDIKEVSGTKYYENHLFVEGFAF